MMKTGRRMKTGNAKKNGKGKQPLKLNDLIRIASAAYPDGLVAKCWDFKTERPKQNHNCGDTLALFVVRELKDTFDPEASSGRQIETAMDALLKARAELEAVEARLATERRNTMNLDSNNNNGRRRLK